jgi:hypothetical protein
MRLSVLMHSTLLRVHGILELRQTKSEKKLQEEQEQIMCRIIIINKIAVKAIIENAAPNKSKTLQLIPKENFLFTFIKLLK